MQKTLLLVVLAVVYATADRAYESSCPLVNPMPDFDMERVSIDKNKTNNNLHLFDLI